MQPYADRLEFSTGSCSEIRQVAGKVAPVRLCGFRGYQENIRQSP